MSGYRVPHRDQAARPACPSCASQYVKRDGKTPLGEQRYICKMCRGRFCGVKTAILSIKREGKSGVFPVPCRGHEFKPLRRDPFAHMQLALVTRG